MNNDFPNGRVFGERFMLQEELGRGGFATVFGAVDTTTGQPVALKILTADGDRGYDADVRARFAREVEIVARLSDPHTVRLVASGNDEDQLWAAFELVTGQDLAELLSQVGRVEAAAARQILFQVLQSLREAHAHGLIHRDLKPENIRVFSFGTGPEDWLIKVLDFGIARSSEAGHPSVTKTGELVGTPRYMSPEQLKGQPLSAASDIYAVGLIGYELIAGRDALAGSAIGEQLERLMPGYEFRVDNPRPGDSELMSILRRMLTVEPTDRVATAEAALRLLVPSEVSRAVTPSAPRARGPVIVGALVLLCAGLVVGLLISRRQTKSAPVVVVERRSNPLAVEQAPLAPVVMDEQQEVEQPTCEKRPSDGIWSLKGSDGIAYIPAQFEPATASLALLLGGVRDKTPRELLQRAGLSTLSDRYNVVVVIPSFREPAAAVKATWNTDTVARAWASMRVTADDFCVPEDARVFGFGIERSGARGVQKLLTHYEQDLTAVAIVAGRRKVKRSPEDDALALVIGSDPDASTSLEGPLIGLVPRQETFAVSTPTARATRDTSRRGNVYESVDEREAELRKAHGCSGEGRASGDNGGRVCRAFDCQVPLEICDAEVDPEGEFPFDDTAWAFFESHGVSRTEGN